MTIIRLVFGVVIFCAIFLSGGIRSQADLLPHRVTYTLGLGTSGSVTGGSGLMKFEIRDVCDGWAMDLKAKIALAGEDGEVHHLGWSQVTWEAKDGKRYRYFSRELSDGEETIRRRGEARRESSTGSAKVIADLPEQVEFTLPKGTLFPVQHTKALINGETSGKTYVLAKLFDGLSENAAVEVGAALGQGSVEWVPPGKAFKDLQAVRSFPTALAFYINNSAEGMPDTEQNMRLFANGVVGSLAFSFGEIKVHAIMDELTPLVPEKC